MRTVNFILVQNKLLEMQKKYGHNSVNLDEFKKDCKTNGISLCNGMKTAFIHSGIIRESCRKVRIFSTEMQSIKNAYAEVAAKRKQYHENSKKPKEPTVAIDEMVEFLKSKGYFVYLPSKDDKVIIEKHLEFTF